ncbi:hypothetical protein EUX98_g1058 [Antrodiella citrinella]|uniref:Uncharacterized protein n=1 Tax=Antrodiella citrinella TaxID=2447956 RepID=A0A4S4N4T1_9APHY|nr:hypothetical protein EUX98_g1058 [Antrodiella citrinella]
MIIERSNKSRMTERKALVRDVEALSKLLAPVSGDPAKKESVLAEPKEYTKKINEFTFACAEWYENKKESRSQELDQIRRTRLMAVVAKLRGLGWDEELNYMDDHGYLGLSRLSSVKQAKPLTDRTWANIRKSVEDFMTEAKTLRLAEVRRGILKDRFQILRQVVHKWRQTSDVLFPNVRDFASMDEVRTIVDIPTSVVLTPESFDVLLPMLPDLVAKWRRDADKQLVDRLRSSCNIGLDMHGSPYGIASRIKKASEEHATAAREVERAATEKIAARADMKARGGWQCASCPVAKFVTKNSVTQHLRSEHGKMDNYEDTDYYLHPDSIPDVADPVCLISSKKDQAYLPMKVTVAMQQGLTAVRDDVSMANTYRYMSRAGAGIYDFDEDEDDFLYDHEYGEYYGMSDDELDFPWY